MVLFTLRMKVKTAQAGTACLAATLRQGGGWKLFGEKTPAGWNAAGPVRFSNYIREKTMTDRKAPHQQPPAYLNDENGHLTAIRAGTISKGDPAELLRGVGQENITARPMRSIAPGRPPQLDDDTTQMRKIEDAAGTAPSPPGVAEPADARSLPSTRGAAHKDSSSTG